MFTEYLAQVELTQWKGSAADTFTLPRNDHGQIKGSSRRLSLQGYEYWGLVAQVSHRGPGFNVTNIASVLMKGQAIGGR